MSAHHAQPRRRRLLLMLVEVLGLQTPRGRLLAFTAVFVVGVLLSWGWLAWVPTLSIYEHLGIPSPSIGLTEALIALLSGDFTGAFARNWLIYPVVSVAVALLAMDAIRYIKTVRQ